MPLIALRSEEGFLFIVDWPQINGNYFKLQLFYMTIVYAYLFSLTPSCRLLTPVIFSDEA